MLRVTVPLPCQHSRKNRPYYNSRVILLRGFTTILYIVEKSNMERSYSGIFFNKLGIFVWFCQLLSWTGVLYVLISCVAAILS